MVHSFEIGFCGFVYFATRLIFREVIASTIQLDP